MTKLSVIVPVYNVEKYLAKCLDSLIYPDLKDYEIIIVNDGSTDSSPEIAAEYRDRYPELIKLISTPNGGLGHARNTGLQAAEGEYAEFVDSDDYLTDGAVPEIMKLISGGSDIYIFDYSPVCEDGRILPAENGSGREDSFSLAEYPQQLFFSPSAVNKIWRRSLFADNNISFPDRLWFEDLATSPKLLLKAEKITYVNKSWYRYLQRSGSIMNNSRLIRNLEINTVIEDVISYYRGCGEYENYKRELEYTAFYNQYLAACVRVNLADRKSEVQNGLTESFYRLFPDYRENPYVQAAPFKYHLLDFLIRHRLRFLMQIIMKLNRAVK